VLLEIDKKTVVVFEHAAAEANDGPGIPEELVRFRVEYNDVFRGKKIAIDVDRFALMIFHPFGIVAAVPGVIADTFFRYLNGCRIGFCD
jgi:hypothetical protein